MLGVLLVAASNLGMRAESLGDIAARLSASMPYHASARYEVLLPQSEEPVVYDVDLQAYDASPSDTLAPCKYVIEWKMNVPEGGSSMGFSAYFDGHHYRFRDKRLQEYHYDDDPLPFAVRGSVRNGVQQQAQFASLLPAFVAERFVEMAADTNHVYAITRDAASGTLKVEGVERYAGCDCVEYTYVFDADGMPVSAEFCNNPGQMSEQTVSVCYGAPGVGMQMAEPNEPRLMTQYPEAFTRYRESGYTLSNLPGRPLPAISAPMPGGERYSRSAGQAFGMPVVVALLDADVDGCAATVEQLRRSVEDSAVPAGLILAFMSNHADAIGEVTGPARPDETVLTRASGLARDCGVTATPTVIVCGSDGVVRNVHTGRNKDLVSIVMQEIAIAK